MSTFDAFEAEIAGEVVAQLAGCTLTLTRTTRGTFDASTGAYAPVTTTATASAVRARSYTSREGERTQETVEYLVRASDLSSAPQEKDTVSDSSDSVVRRVTSVTTEVGSAMLRIRTSRTLR